MIWEPNATTKDCLDINDDYIEQQRNLNILVSDTIQV